MTKKKSRKPPISPEQRLQRETLANLREELSDLHEVSLMIMSDQGILPPLYGGEYLGEKREAIPLWGIIDDKPELGVLLLRIQPGTEPNRDLRALRLEFGLDNDWPIAELLDMLKRPDGKSMIEGADEIRKLSMMLALFGNQIKPAAGYDADAMIEYIATMQPYAVFPVVPTSTKDDDLTYLWDDLDHFQAEVIYADSPSLLEAAVWEYRLNLALKEDITNIVTDGGKPEDELMAQDVAGLSALYELLVMEGVRFYGTTSPVRTRQQELDVLREENGDLIIRGPLKADVEPIPFLADARKDIDPDEHGEILHLAGTEEGIQRIWPQVRANNVFSIRVRHGVMGQGRNGRLKVSGYSENAVMEWAVADNLPDLYRQVRLAGIYEMLAACGMVKAKMYEVAPEH